MNTSDTVDELGREDPLEGETLLWRAVIRQALSDATLTNDSDRDLARFWLPRRVAKERREDLYAARTWFREGDDDFHLVCELAGLVAAKVQAWALAEIRRFDQAVGAYHLDLRLWQR
jgi:hypothetical protein